MDRGEILQVRNIFCNHLKIILQKMTAKIFKINDPVKRINSAIIGKNGTTQSEGLKRELGVADVATNVVNITIGSGIFLMPAIIADIVGSASIVAYVLCGFMFLLVVLCFAEAGSRISNLPAALTLILKKHSALILVL